MKFKIEPVKIPQDKREDINNKILYCIDNNVADQYNITKADIATMYSGNGGLSGLEFNNFDNYHEFSEAKKSIELGSFYTPDFICKFMTDCIKPTQHDLIADLTFGCGRFFNHLPTESNIYGTEIDIKAYKVAKYLYPEANIVCEDIRMYNPDVKFDVVIGNPPFGLKWQVGRDEYLSQLYFCIKAAQLLKPAGLMCIIVPNSFLSDDFSDKGMIREVSDRFNFVCQFDLSPYAFKDVGVSYFETKVMIFQNKSEYLDNVDYSTGKIELHDMSESESDRIYNTYVKPLIDEKEKVKNKIFFENLHTSDSKEDIEFGYKVKKLLYDIKRNPKILKKFAKAQEYVNKYYNQVKPENMDYEEWNKVRVTMPKVISYLTKVVKEQHKIEYDKIELVKTNGSIKLKAYSRKMKLILNKYTDTKEMDINSMVYHNQYPFSDSKFARLIEKKRKNYLHQTKDFNKMAEDINISNFIKNTVLYDSVEDKEIRLNKIQREDLNKIIQKKYGLIQYSMGGGKTLLGTIYSLYRLKYNNIHNPIIIGESIAIKGTWVEKLENYGIDFILINKLEDFKKIKQGQFVLMTLYMVNKYKKQIKEYLKTHNKKFALIFDESDSITSLNTIAYKSILNCFRRLVKYKVLMTGTSTRNNANEIFGQLELLYNNSINMLSMSDYIYETNKKENTINEVLNDKLFKPFSPYKKGFAEFKSNYSPSKATVFGLDKYNQDIYNSEDLSNLLNYTVITKTFVEITGRNPFDGEVIPCFMNKWESIIYDRVITKFHELENKFYSSTGSSKKDAMLRALHQLNLLIRTCSRFHLIENNYISDLDYNYNIISSKHKEIVKYIRNVGCQRVAIGCIEKASCDEYERILKHEFPNRKIFVVNGEKYNITQRKALIKEFKKYEDCIIISTQESMSCSLNIGFIDIIIIPELQYNNSKIEQFAYRFIRYDSKNLKTLKFFLYANSIEINILKLVMVKEKINLFMKGEQWSDDQLKEKYGVDFELEKMLMYKEKDDEGKLKIVWNQWGEQQIV